MLLAFSLDGECGGGCEGDEPLLGYVFFALCGDAVDLAFGEPASDGVVVVAEEGCDVVCGEHIGDAAPFIVKPLAEILRDLAGVKDVCLRLQGGLASRGEDGGDRVLFGVASARFYVGDKAFKLDAVLPCFLAVVSVCDVAASIQTIFRLLTCSICRA